MEVVIESWCFKARVRFAGYKRAKQMRNTEILGVAPASIPNYLSWRVIYWLLIVNFFILGLESNNALGKIEDTKEFCCSLTKNP